MTKEKLLEPRFKVIADYPNSPFPVGHIYGGPLLEQKTIDRLNKFPHLFQPIQWFEMRKVEDLPLYLMDNKDAIPKGYKINHYKVSDSYSSIEFYRVMIDNSMWARLPDLLPATEQEYTDYINSK